MTPIDRVMLKIVLGQDRDAVSVVEIRELRLGQLSPVAVQARVAQRTRRAVGERMKITKCNAQVRIYIGQMFPSFVPCSKLARQGHSTCWWHRNDDPAKAAVAQLKAVTKRRK
jgi:hypothetical protein